MSHIFRNVTIEYKEKYLVLANISHLREILKKKKKKDLKREPWDKLTQDIAVSFSNHLIPLSKKVPTCFGKILTSILWQNAQIGVSFKLLTAKGVGIL